MANTASAKKAARRNERRTAVNRSRRSRMRTFVRKIEEALAAGTEAFKTAEPELMKAAQKGIIHKNTAARKVSRLAKAVKALGA